MLRTLVLLPDGTELFSGVGLKDAIQSITITECVNSGQELTLGSCCANMVELKLFTPGGGVCIHAGDELEIYRLSDAGGRYKVGIFTAEKPTRPTANSLQVTAYDRVTRLDKDLTQWFAGLDAWPYTLFDLASMTCEACGLVLKNTEIPNGGYPVRQFSPDGITGRQLMQWIGEAAGRFCRATEDGDLEFTWYTPADGVAISTTKTAEEIVYSNGNLQILSEDIVAEDDGEGNVILISDRLSASDDGAGNVSLSLEKAAEQIPFFQNGLTFEDFEVAPIEKVQIRQNEEDVGTVYPDGIPDAVNTYIITGNPLLSAVTGDELTPVAEVLFDLLRGVRYTPCKVAVPASSRIHAGNTVEITDRNGRTITAYVMTKVQKGQKDTLECTGSSSRDSTTTFNNRQIASLQGKVLNLRMDVEGLRVENTDQAGKLTQVEVDLQGIRGQVSTQTEQLGNVTEQITKVDQTAKSLQISVETIQNDGVGKVKTAMGYTFDDTGLHIAKEGQQMKNLLDNTGMYVTRDGQTVLQANDKGVVAVDVQVLNYLEVGEHARFEDYSDGSDTKRTACFHIGK